jgi:hypothetical protein
VWEESIFFRKYEKLKMKIMFLIKNFIYPFFNSFKPKVFGKLSKRPLMKRLESLKVSVRNFIHNTFKPSSKTSTLDSHDVFDFC